MELNIEYVSERNFSPFYVNGCHGGITPQGEITINFFLERPHLPEKEVIEAEIGKPPVTKSLIPDGIQNKVVRTFETGVLMNLGVAKNIYSWLGEHIKLLDEIAKKNAI